MRGWHAPGAWLWFRSSLARTAATVFMARRNTTGDGVALGSSSGSLNDGLDEALGHELAQAALAYPFGGDHLGSRARIRGLCVP